MTDRFSSLFQRLQDQERTFALIIGILFFFVGIAGFVPGFVSVPGTGAEAPLSAPNITYTDGFGNVLGLFPTNFLHNAVHVSVGILGIAAATSFGGALSFNRAFAIAYAAIALMGLLPWTNTTFGLMPIFGNNVWLNAFTAAAAAYYGFFKPAKVQAEAESSLNV